MDSLHRDARYKFSYRTMQLIQLIQQLFIGKLTNCWHKTMMSSQQILKAHRYKSQSSGILRLLCIWLPTNALMVTENSTSALNRMAEQRRRRQQAGGGGSGGGGGGELRVRPARGYSSRTIPGTAQRAA
jgi:hypothetical protein